MESAGLLAVCLRKVKGLSKAKVLSAAWVWTEPHSMRLKIAVDVEKSVLDGKMQLKQRVIIEFMIKHKQCLDCIRENSDHIWGAQVQLRQKSVHKTSLASLEALLTRGGFHNIMLGAEMSKHGMDFFFRNRSQAEKVVNFISSNLPTKIKISQRLVSTDVRSNISKYEHVYLVEVPSISKGDLVFIPKSSGQAAEIMLVSKVSTSVHLINPTTMKKLELISSKFFSNPLKALRTSNELVSYIVLDAEPLASSDGHHFHSGARGGNDKSELKASGLLAEIEVCSL